MSQYLKYVLNRAGAPEPCTIAVHPTRAEWADRQLFDELRETFPIADLSLYSNNSPADLLVVASLDKYPDFSSLRSNPVNAPWVMLYGLESRRIWVLRSTDAHIFLNKISRLSTLRKILQKSRTIGLFAWLIRFWKYRIHR